MNEHEHHWNDRMLVLRARWRNSAFSLVELLVVIAIISLLVGFLLPAIQAARESSRRNDCLNRLKQLSLAMHNYEAAQGHFPSGSVAQADPNDPAMPHTFYRWSAFAQVMPHFENAALYAQLDLSLPMYRKDFSIPDENQATLEQIIPSMLCPSDRMERVSPRFGPTNYAASAGSGIEGGTPLTADGVFYINSRVSLAEIADGTSQTVYLAETTLGDFIPQLTPRDQVEERTAYVFASAAPLTQTACDATILFNFTDPPGFSWANGEYRSAMYNHYRPPNSSELDCMSAKLLSPLSERYAAFGWRSARSMHPGGVNAARVDGSVRFYSDDINPAVWRALATRSGEETISADSQ